MLCLQLNNKQIEGERIKLEGPPSLIPSAIIRSIIFGSFLFKRIHRLRYQPLHLWDGPYLHNLASGLVQLSLCRYKAKMLIN